MAYKGPSPEEQLLNLIEKGDGTKKLGGFKKKRREFSSFILKLKKFLSSRRWVDRLIQKIKDRIKRPNFEVVNRILVGICVVLVGYSVFDFMFNRRDISKFYERMSTLKYITEEPQDIVALRPFLHYLAIVQRRNIFGPIKLEKEVDRVKKRKETLDKLLAELILVGISWEEEPLAMIENTKVEQTYFLREGEIINSLKIEKILKNKVILSYEGAEAELI